MWQRLLIIFPVFFLIFGCSDSEPADNFLNAKMRIISPITENGETELLHMKPIDLYTIFDLNVTKKWEKEYNNSWSLVIDGEDPVTKIKTRFIFTLSMKPELNNDVIMEKLTVNGEDYNTAGIAELIHQLDSAFAAQQKKR